MTSHGYIGFTVVDRSQDDRRRIGARTSSAGRRDNPVGVAKALDGETVVAAPFTSMAALKTADGTLQTGVPTMFVDGAGERRESPSDRRARPAHSTRGATSREFCSWAVIGDSGETYAFNSDGLMLSNSRF